MNIENATKEETEKLKAENQKAVLLQKDIDNIRDQEYGLEMLIDERRNASRQYLKSKNDLEKSKGRVSKMRLYSSMYANSMKKLNNDIVLNELNKEMNDQVVNTHRKSVEADQQSYMAQEKLKHMMSDKYSDYVLESAKINRKIQ